MKGPKESNFDHLFQEDSDCPPPFFVAFQDVYATLIDESGRDKRIETLLKTIDCNLNENSMIGCKENFTKRYEACYNTSIFSVSKNLHSTE